MNWLSNTDVVRIQQRNHQDCSIASLAMALGCTYEELEVELLPLSAGSAFALACSYKKIGTINPLTAQETTALLATKGAKPVHLISKEAAEYFCGAYGTQLLPISTIKQMCNSVPAILSVQGGRELHAVYWTGSEVIDPAPGRDKPRKWTDYQVLEAVLIY